MTAIGVPTQERGHERRLDPLVPTLPRGNKRAWPQEGALGNTINNYAQANTFLPQYILTYNDMFAVQPLSPVDRPAYALRGCLVTVCENELGELRLLLNGSLLSFQVFHEQPKQAVVVSTKELNQTPFKPAADHPWRNYEVRLNGHPVQS